MKPWRLEVWGLERWWCWCSIQRILTFRQLTKRTLSYDHPAAAENYGQLWAAGRDGKERLCRQQLPSLWVFAVVLSGSHLRRMFQQDQAEGSRLNHRGWDLTIIWVRMNHP